MGEGGSARVGVQMGESDDRVKSLAEEIALK